MIAILSCAGSAKVFALHSETEELLLLDKHTYASEIPRQYVVFINKNATHVLDILKHSMVFVVNFLEDSYKHLIVSCGAHKDPYEATGLTRATSEKIDCPRIKEATEWLECEVVRFEEIGNSIMVLGRILN